MPHADTVFSDAAHPDEETVEVTGSFARPTAAPGPVVLTDFTWLEAPASDHLLLEAIELPEAEVANT